MKLLYLLLFLMNLISSCGGRSSSPDTFQDITPCPQGQEYSDSLGLCYTPEQPSAPVKSPQELCLEDGQQWLPETSQCVAPPSSCEDCVSEETPEPVTLVGQPEAGKIVTVDNKNVHISFAVDSGGESFLLATTIHEGQLLPRSHLKRTNETILAVSSNHDTVYVLTSDNNGNVTLLAEEQGTFTEILKVNGDDQVFLASATTTDGLLILSEAKANGGDGDLVLKKFAYADSTLKDLTRITAPQNFNPHFLQVEQDNIIIIGELRQANQVITPAIAMTNIDTVSTMVEPIPLVDYHRVEIKSVVAIDGDFIIATEALFENSLDRDLYFTRISADGEVIWSNHIGSFRRDEIVSAKLLGDSVYVTGTSLGSFIKEYNYGSPASYLMRISPSSGRILTVNQTVNDNWEIPSDIFLDEDEKVKIIVDSIDRSLPESDWLHEIKLYSY